LASVHHLVRTVTGNLAPQYDALDLFRACFPGGSITGAPKLRAMEIIDELESGARSVYCGAIGYIGYDGAMDSNVAIRTMVYRDGIIKFWAGGGIVADSQLQSEYKEFFDKVARMFSLFDANTTDRISGQLTR
jgi:para-aminobenzoate synthetase component 1